MHVLTTILSMKPSMLKTPADHHRSRFYATGPPPIGGHTYDRHVKRTVQRP